jgi:spore coat protein U-like protein
MNSTFAKFALIAAMSTVALSAAPASFAASKTSTFQVSLTVQNDCSIAANALDFGSAGVIQNNIDVNTTLAVTCTKGTPYDVALDAGTVSGSSIASRQMAGANNGDTVKFNLFRNASRTLLWGQTSGVDTATDIGNGSAQSLTVYGRVPPQAVPSADDYRTTVTATVVF